MRSKELLEHQPKSQYPEAGSINDEEEEVPLLWKGKPWEECPESDSNDLKETDVA